MEQSKTNSFVIWVIHYLCLVSLESWARVTTPPWIMFKIWWVIRTTAQKQKSSCQQPKYLGKLWAKNLSLKLFKRKNSHVTNDKKVFFKASCHEIFKSNKLLFRCRGLTSVFFSSSPLLEVSKERSFMTYKLILLDFEDREVQC